MTTDISLDDALDLLFGGGDLVVSESTAQHLMLLLKTDKGDWRERPYVGVGLRALLLDEAAPVAVQKEIQQQLEVDGVTVAALELRRDGKINVQGSYD